MQTLTLSNPLPEYGTNVTRLWLAPGLARVGAVFGNDIRYNGAAAVCWDTAARRAALGSAVGGLGE